MKKSIELLSPAGNFNALKCAINNGADAVYLGLSEFNARSNIENFNIENLADAVMLAHLHNVKVYLTLNTLVGDSEFEEILKLVKKALLCKIDAFIVQDIGLAYFLRANFPYIELHASTQMGICNLEGIKALKDINFSRVVLARETPLSEIKRISENCSIPLEYFIQGALCVSFSGNCYLCSLLAGASGNRGKCKQFCRLPYMLEHDSTKERGYFLSTKDFCMLQYLKELYRSGVSSFKIEGRARREGYVAVATGVYRQAIDNNFIYNEKDKEELKYVFNRGDFISGYFGQEKIIYSKSQNHIGVEIGKIEEIRKGKKFNEIHIKSSKKLKKGDVLKIFDREREIGVISVVDFKELENGKYILTSKAEFPKNSNVRMIINSDLEGKYLANQKKISVKASLILQPGEKAVVFLESAFTKIKYESDIVVEQVKTAPLTKQDCQKQFAKLGDEFILEEIEIDLGDAFLTKAQLNLLRRESLKKLEENILINYQIRENIDKKAQFSPKNIEITDILHKNGEIIEFSDFSKIKFEDEKLYIYKPASFDEQILSSYKKFSKYKIFISLPIMADGNEINLIKKILNQCSNWGVVANNYYTLYLTTKEKTIIGSGLNVFNSYAVKFYAEHGFKNIILSFENHDYIKNCGVNTYSYKSFFPEYMYFRHCPYKENLGSTCQKCNYDNKLTYKLNNVRFDLKRIKLLSCQFVLKSKEEKTMPVPKNCGIIEEV